MKLGTRMKITYAMVFIVPLLLIGISFWGIGRLELQQLGGRYGVADANLSITSDPFSMFNNIGNTVISQLQTTIQEKPAALDDVSYLEDINSQLGTYSSFIIVRRQGEIYFNGSDDDDVVIEDTDGYQPAGNYIIGDTPYHLRQIDFNFANGDEGSIQILTPVTMVVDQLRNIYTRLLVISVIILFVASSIAIFWLYQSIVQPLGKLKVAAENIKDGNLDFNVVTEAEDEIGELCTAFEEMRSKLKEQIDINMQYEKENKELISNISHDLKTPITAIKGYVEGIRDGVADTPEKMDKYIRTIYNKATDMDKLIDELFLYSKLDSNSLNYSFAKINVNDYFEDCADEISLDLESRNIIFSYHNYVDKDTIIIADPEQLKRVINNIVGNSVKYTGNKQGVISLRIKDEPEFIQVEIEDNGKGIAKNELPRIFERSYRTDASRNSSQGGSGLGLSIAKKIIEEHGGKIWARSTEGMGTTLCFVLRKYRESGIYE
ncbi:MAG TPA: HAMP domain-containing histidine kinase [Candidatus Onthocola gallistercoris]|uniref:histidine kinase n=1 Tax=Candidatus Onthocola gallistercoris TaxID=2840876 RepID=A0A9D1HHG8_9FIRM|nr:HAMP domain-containing histidine kinase [Candidatus Onthocola gallistercoris]